MPNPACLSPPSHPFSKPLIIIPHVHNLPPTKLRELVNGALQTNGNLPRCTTVRVTKAMLPSS